MAVARPDRFWLFTAFIAVDAAIVRGLAVWAAHEPLVVSDPLIFHRQGVLLAEGRAFVDPFAYDLCGVEIPGAQFPPLFPAVLGLSSFLGASSELSHRIVAAALGVATVVLVAMVARRIAGGAAGIAGAGVAAVYPYFWGTEVRILSEALLLPIVALVLLAAWTYLERPTTRGAALLSLAIGAATLTRAEMGLLYPLLAVPALVIAYRRGDRVVVTEHGRLGWMRPALAMAAVAVVTIGAWASYNATRFDRPVPVSAGLGATLAGANCDAAYRGELVGWWVFDCLPAVEERDGSVTAVPASGESFDYCRSPQVTVDASVRDEAMREHALDYAGDHASELPRVSAARLGRALELFATADTIDLQAVQGRPAAVWATVAWWAVVPFAIAGGFVLRHRGVSVLPPLALVSVVAITAVTTYGHPRFRLAADVALVVLSGVAIAALVSTRRGVGKDHDEAAMRGR